MKVASESKQDRAKKANELIETIASCGRRFFDQSWCGRGICRFEIDQRGRLWFWDDLSETRIYLGYKYWQKGFSHGGTLRDFVNALAWYIRTGEPIPDCHLSPWPKNYWGYGDDMEQVRTKAVELGIARAEVAAT